MRTTVTKIGNSIGLIIPKKMAQAIGVSAGCDFELTHEDGKLIATPCDESITQELLKSCMSVARKNAYADPEITNPEEHLARVEALMAECLMISRVNRVEGRGGQHLTALFNNMAKSEQAEK